MAEHVNEIVMRDETPLSLSEAEAEAEAELDTNPLARTPKPLPVKVWVHYDTIAINVDARRLGHLGPSPSSGMRQKGFVGRGFGHRQ